MSLKKKFIFVKLQDTKFDQPMGWYLKITSWVELMYYYSSYIDNNAYVALNIIKSFRERPDNSHSPFPCSTMGSAIHALSRCRAEDKGSICIQDVADIIEDCFKAKAKCLKDFGWIYIHKNNSFMCPALYFEEIGCIESEQIIYPKDEDKVIKIVISSWKQGSHYYITIDGVQTELNDIGKWDLYSDALYAIDKYMLEENKNRRYTVERKARSF